MVQGTISGRGQVVIPVEIREKLKIRPGTRVSIEEIDGEIRVIPLSAVLVRKYAGFLGHDPDAGRKFLVERRKDAARSEAKLKRLVK